MMGIRTKGVALAMLAATALLASATGFADEATLTGTWNLTIDSPQGKRTPTLTLTQSGSTLTGTYKSKMGEAPVTGKVTGDEFALDVKLERQGQEMTVAYKGTVSGSDMKGMLYMGRMGNVPFTGVKAQP
jgi:hypothetical protein